MKNSMKILVAAGVLTLVASPALADWGSLWGTQNGTNRASGTALITGEGETAAGYAWSVPRENEALTSAELTDLNGDGIPEILFVASGRVFALTPSATGTAWTSPAFGVDAILGFAEVDGDASAPELVATSSETSGGFEFLDPAAGGLLGSVEGFPLLSGILSTESVIYDLDGDGIDELVHPPGRGGLGKLWITTLDQGISNSGFLEVSFSGYANFTPAFVGDFLGTGDPAIAIDQGVEWTLFPTCDPGDAGAVCDDASGNICLCDGTKFFSLNATYAFGPRWVLDTDTDNRDEVLFVGNHPLYVKAIGALDFGAGLAGGTPNADATRQWYRRYMATSLPPQLQPLSDGPVQLDGAGPLELVVSFFNNTGDDANVIGTVPNEDGINHPDAVSVGVFDISTGDLVASLLDTTAWGVVDLDADGLPELVTSPTSDFSFQTGLTGWELDCTSTCTLVQAWTEPDLTLHRELAALEDRQVPTPELYTVDVDGDGTPELLAYDGANLLAVQGDGTGGLTTLASRVLLPDEVLLASDPATNTALLTSADQAVVLDEGLGTVGLPIPLAPRGWSPFAAASLDGGVREAPIFSRRVYQTVSEPSSPTDADLELLGQLAITADLDGDGAAEVISYANPGTVEGDDSSFEVTVERWNDTTSSFDMVWQFDSESEASLEGFTIGPPLHFATGDFDGVGSQDLVVEVAGGGVFRYLILDGDTGSIDAELTPTERVATASPLLVADLVDASGTGAPDGIDDILFGGANLVSLHTVASGEIWSVDVGGFIHGVCSYADVDADGEVEMVATLSVGVENRAEVIDDLDGTPTTTWGPQTLPLPTGTAQVLAIADVDSVAGDDLVYVTGSGGLYAYSGSTGTLLPGFPVYLAEGALSTTEVAGAATPLSLITLDTDDDGYEEAIVGTIAGLIYAVDIAENDPNAGGLAWSFDAGAAVRALAAADTDGDGYDEILVSTDDGLGSVLDGVGVQLEITFPTETDCVPSNTFEVTGTAIGLDTVEIFLAGNSISGDVDATSGFWSGLAQARLPGSYVLEARGKDASGSVALIDSVIITVGEGGDADSDGYFACGDCDDSDPEINPGAEDICEDGIDQDCDGADEVCGDDDDSGDDDDTSDDDDSTGDDDDTTEPDEPGGCGGCDCESSAAGSGAGPSLFLVLLSGLLVRRRRP